MVTKKSVYLYNEKSIKVRDHENETSGGLYESSQEE